MAKFDFGPPSLRFGADSPESFRGWWLGAELD